MTNNSVIWKTRIFDNEILKNKLLSQPSNDHHPLKSMVITERVHRRILGGSMPSTGRSTPIKISSPYTETDSLATILNQKLDPLSVDIEEIDPLTRMAAEQDLVDQEQSKTSNTKEPKQNHIKSIDPIKSWSTRKNAILQKYTTSEKLSLVTSFLSEGETIVIKTQSPAIDKVQHRLEQLDAFEEGSQRRLNLSQTEYIARIEQLNKELILAWNIEQRVKSLKIVIQCAKMLADTDVLSFYPSKFVLVTNILDCFGNLVYERLKGKAEIKNGTVSADSASQTISDVAKETCSNWFFKIASIRELVPRLYVEMALLKSYKFMSISNFGECLLRITQMIQGIGNPLVAIYARCHLCRIGLTLIQKDSNNFEYLKRNLEYFLESYRHNFSRNVSSQLLKQNISLPSYIALYTPALDYIIHCVTYYYSDNVLDDLLIKCKTYSNR